LIRIPSVPAPRTTRNKKWQITVAANKMSGNAQGKLIMLKKELLDILACPQCKGPVELNTEQNGIICRTCQLLYEIRNDIPIMLIDEAKPLIETKG